MKRLSIFLGAMVAMSAWAQTSSKEESLEASTAKRAKENPPTIDLSKPNEITVGSLTYSGIVVQMVKTDNLLQLINPAAPEKYGAAEDNVVRDPISYKVSGLKVFSIQF
jgi:hypothetical protein